MPVKPPVGIRDVAAHAGVSVATVSNVLNRPDIVAPPTRMRVLASIKALGFVRKEERITRLQRRGTLVVLVDSRAPSGGQCSVSVDVLGGDLALWHLMDAGHERIAYVGGPLLSAIRQPRHELGRAAAQLLLGEARDDDTHRHRQVIFEPELVVRQSTQARQPAASTGTGG